MREGSDIEERTKNQLCDKLVGEQLSEVSFVQDYLQLHFDGPKLTCYIFPTLEVKAKVIGLSDDGYRDLLCKFIAQTVNTIEYAEGKQLTIVFANEDKICLNLDPSNPEIVAEIGIFWDDDGGMWVLE